MPVIARLININPINQFVPKIYDQEDTVSPEKKRNIRKFLAAVINNDRVCVERLLDDGLDVNSEGDQKETALMNAVFSGNVDMCRLLIGRGCDVNKSGTVPPFYFSLTPLCQSVISGNQEITQLLLQSGCQKDRRDDLGRSALFYCDNSDMLRLLLAAGCDVNLGAKDTNYTLLHEAVAKGRLGIVKVLLEAGANPNNYEVNQHQTPGFFTTRKDIHKELVKYGASINHTSRYGDTILHHAISHGDLPLVEFFLEKGAILNSTETSCIYSTHNILQQVTQHNPLQQAVVDHYFDICVRLIQHGCSTEFVYWDDDELVTRLLNSENTELIMVLLFATGNTNWLKRILTKSYNHVNSLNISLKTREWLWKLSGHVFPLRMAACHVIRRQIQGNLSGESIFREVQKLSLPEIIQDCIMIKLQSG